MDINRHDREPGWDYADDTVARRIGKLIFHPVRSAKEKLAEVFDQLSAANGSLPPSSPPETSEVATLYPRQEQ